MFSFPCEITPIKAHIDSDLMTKHHMKNATDGSKLRRNLRLRPITKESHCLTQKSIQLTYTFLYHCVQAKQKDVEL